MRGPQMVAFEPHDAPLPSRAARLWRASMGIPFYTASKRRIRFLCLLGAAAGLCVFQHAIAEEVFDVTIAPQQLSSALQELAHQTGADVVFFSEVTKSHAAPQVNGRYTLTAALTRLLSGTGLSFRLLDDASFTVYRPEADAGSELTRAGGSKETPDTRQHRLASRNGRGFLRRMATTLGNALIERPLRTAEPENAPPKAEVEEAPDNGSQQSLGGVETIVVTGTRMAIGDPTVRVDSITSETMSALGLVTVSDVVRSIPGIAAITSIPQTVASNSPPFNLDCVPMAVEDRGDPYTFIGVATANMRGLGTENTLVLVNGRRIAGMPGSPNFTTNLRDIPTEAIERVELMMDSGSVLYGSDAIGGVINVITRKDYTGLSASVQTQYGSAGSSRQEYRLSLGKAWRNGSLSFATSKGASVPLSRWQAGDNRVANLTPAFDADPHYIRRDHGNVNVPIIYAFPWGPYFTVDRHNDGRNLSVDEIRPIEKDDLVGAIDQNGSERTSDFSVTVDFRQELLDALTLTLEYIRNRDWSSANPAVSSVTFEVPASNAFNPFDHAVWVYYRPNVEVANGLIPPDDYVRTTSSNRAFAALKYAFSESTDFTVQYQTSWSASVGRIDMFHRPADPDQRAKIGELLASDDPEVAVNFFGDGTAQNDTIGFFHTRYSPSYPNARLRNFEWFLRTKAPRLGQRDIHVLIGSERRTQSTKSSRTRGFTGFDEPEQVLQALFAESHLTLFDEKHAKPGIKRLALSLKGRYDRFAARGQYVDPYSGETVATSRANSRFTPRLGIRWDVNDSLSWMGSWGQSFRAPSVIELQLGRGVIRDGNPFDPLCGYCAHPDAVSVYGANPSLRPEYSTNLNLFVNWRPSRIPGLDIRVDYRRVDYRDKITDSHALGRLLPPEEFGRLEEVFVRNDDGVLLQEINYPMNISRRYQRIIDLDISQQIPIAPGAGELEARLYASYPLDYYEQAFKDSRKVGVIGSPGGIQRYSLFGEIRWRKDNMALTAVIDHAPGSDDGWDAISTYYAPQYEGHRIGSRTTVDLSGSYEMANGLRFHLGSKNLFNRRHPFAFGRHTEPYDASRIDLRGRVVFLEVSYNRSRR